uniref:Uncharacterized protein n=1 Tax=Oryza nivara TaxID=4536 RepID=A0A0E0ILC6_ORYNI
MQFSFCYYFVGHKEGQPAGRKVAGARRERRRPDGWRQATRRRRRRGSRPVGEEAGDTEAAVRAAARDISTAAVVWALTHVVQHGDTILLLAVMLLPHRAQLWQEVLGVSALCRGLCERPQERFNIPAQAQAQQKHDGSGGRRRGGGRHRAAAPGLILDGGGPARVSGRREGGEEADGGREGGGQAGGEDGMMRRRRERRKSEPEPPPPQRRLPSPPQHRPPPLAALPLSPASRGAVVSPSPASAIAGRRHPNIGRPPIHLAPVLGGETTARRSHRLTFSRVGRPAAGRPPSLSPRARGFGLTKGVT